MSWTVGGVGSIMTSAVVKHRLDLTGLFGLPCGYTTNNEIFRKTEYAVSHGVVTGHWAIWYQYPRTLETSNVLCCTEKKVGIADCSDK